jgi:FkbM family methyltransferase
MKRPPTVEFRYGGRNYKFETVGEDDLIHQEFLQFGTFLERPTLEVIRRRQLYGVYMDVGANIGGHSVYFAHECPATQILAFEGNPEVANLWKRNVQTNEAKAKARLHEHFVSSFKNLSFHRHPTNAGGSHVEPQPDGNHQAKPLDEYLENNGKVVFVKIDVEGHELEVLKSGEKVLLRHRPELCIEILKPDQSGVFAYLASLGYAWYGELSNANHYFVPLAGIFDRWIHRLENSKTKSLRSIGWRLRLLQAARLRIVPLKKAIFGITLQKGLRQVILDSMREELT